METPKCACLNEELFDLMLNKNLISNLTVNLTLQIRNYFVNGNSSSILPSAISLDPLGISPISKYLEDPTIQPVDPIVED